MSSCLHLHWRVGAISHFWLLQQHPKSRDDYSTADGPEEHEAELDNEDQRVKSLEYQAHRRFPPKRQASYVHSIVGK